MSARTFRCLPALGDGLYSACLMGGLHPILQIKAPIPLRPTKGLTLLGMDLEAIELQSPPLSEVWAHILPTKEAHILRTSDMHRNPPTIPNISRREAEGYGDQTPTCVSDEDEYSLVN